MVDLSYQVTTLKDDVNVGLLNPGRFEFGQLVGILGIMISFVREFRSGV